MSLNLWAEVTVSGFFYISAIFFFVLGLAGVKDIGSFAPIKDYSTLIIFVVVIFSYIVGLFALRMIQLTFSGPVQFFAKRLNIKSLIADDGPKIHGYEIEAVIFQFGSERLQTEMDYQYNHLVLLSSLVFSFPLLGIGLGFWFYTLNLFAWIFPVVVIGLIFGILFFVLSNRQRFHFFEFRQDAYRLVKEKVMTQKSK